MGLTFHRGEPQESWPASKQSAPSAPPPRQPTSWHCSQCQKKLGDFGGTTMIVAHGHVSIAAGLPIQRTCERCGRLNSFP